MIFRIGRSLNCRLRRLVASVTDVDNQVSFLETHLEWPVVDEMFDCHLEWPLVDEMFDCHPE